VISGSWSAAGGRYLPAFWHVLVVASHSPPALSQSVFDLTCERSVDLPPLVDGLADGDVVDGVLDEPGLEPPIVLELPDEPLLSELPEVPPEPLLVPWAAAMAGPKPRTRTSSANSKSFMTSSP